MKKTPDIKKNDHSDEPTNSPSDTNPLIIDLKKKLVAEEEKLQAMKKDAALSDLATKYGNGVHKEFGRYFPSSQLIIKQENKILLLKTLIERIGNLLNKKPNDKKLKKPSARSRKLYAMDSWGGSAPQLKEFHKRINEKWIERTSFKRFEEHFLAIDEETTRLRWKGTENEIKYFVECLLDARLLSSKIVGSRFMWISKHFINKEGGKFDNLQLAKKSTVKPEMIESGHKTSESVKRELIALEKIVKIINDMSGP